MNVEQFAQELKLPPQLLLEQLKAAGVSKNDVVDPVTEADKAHLLDYLRKMHGGGARPARPRSPSRASRPVRSARPTAPASRAPFRWKCASRVPTSSAMPLRWRPKPSLWQSPCRKSNPLRWSRNWRSRGRSQGRSARRDGCARAGRKTCPAKPAVVEPVAAEPAVVEPVVPVVEPVVSG